MTSGTALLAILALVGCGSSNHEPTIASASSSQTTAQSTATVSAPSASSHASAPAVATVAGSPITYTEFAHQYTVDVRRRAGLILDPPSYTKCMARVAETSAPIAANTSAAVRRLIEGRWRGTCEEEQRSHVENAMQTVIRRRWSTLAAHKARVGVSSSEVRALAEQELDSAAQSYARQQSERLGEAGGGEEGSAEAHSAAARQKYLSATGLSMADLEAEATAQLLFEELRSKAGRASRGGAAGDTAQEEFDRRFIEQWTRQTSCVAGFIVGLCENASPSLKDALLPHAPPTSVATSAPPTNAGPHVAANVVKVATDPGGAERYTTPTHVAVAAGKVKFEFENPSAVPDVFAVEAGANEGPLGFTEEFARGAKSLKLTLAPGAYTIMGFGRSGPVVHLTVG